MRTALRLAIAALLAPRHPPLTPAQPRFGVAVVPGIFDLRTVREYCKVVQPHVNSDFSGARRERLRFALDAEANEPSAGLTFDRQGFDLTFQWAVQVDSQVTGPCPGPGVCRLAAAGIRRRRMGR